jgi:tRNA threonylcarbamoyladenosine biosynthesis protein TsaB
VLILAVDTTNRHGSIAVVDDDRVLSLIVGDDSRTHGERLPAEIARALDEAHVDRHQIDLLAVSTGPGGFTGLRIGLAAVQGLALTLGKPVVGISAMDALAAQVREPVRFIAPWIDAQRGDVFAALIDAIERRTIESPVAAHPVAVLEQWHRRIGATPTMFIGDATMRDGEAIARIGGGEWRTQLHEPLAPHVARLARGAAGEGKAGPPHALTPLYVRRPDAEIEKERRNG